MTFFFFQNHLFRNESLGDHLCHPQLMNSWISKMAPIWDAKRNPPGRSGNGLWEPLANQGSNGPAHADIIGPAIFFSQNELASRAGKTIFLLHNWFFPNLTSNQSGKPILETTLSCRRNPHCSFRRAFGLRKTIIFVWVQIRCPKLKWPKYP
jgi:hypothetical protein